MKRKTPWKFLIILLIVGLLSTNINMTGITMAQATHDVAVVEVTPLVPQVGYGLNESANLAVVVENQGTVNENFTVTVSYGNETHQDTFIDTQNVTDLAPDSNETLTFTWNTTGVTVGRYFFNATASSVPGETDTADNTFISPSDPVTLTANTIAVVSPYITMLPRNTFNTTLKEGEYTVSIITNYDEADIWGYQFALSYNPTVLNGVDVVNGDLITEGDVEFNAGTFNDTIGRLDLTTAWSEDKSEPQPYPLLNNTGPGVLANVTFTIIGEGDSLIEFELMNSQMKRTNGTNIIDWLTHLDPDPTEGKFLDGSFQNVETVVHDMAVIDLVFSPNNVTAGEPVNINVTIKNKGTATEEVIVKVHWGFGGGVPLHPVSDPETVTIGSGENKTIPFTWDTTDVTDGTHPLVASVDYAFVGTEDANPLDNMKIIDPAVTVEVFKGTAFSIDLIIIVAVVIVALVAIYVIIRKIRK